MDDLGRSAWSAEHANPWGYRRVPRWRRVACWLVGHRWAFVVGKRPSGGDRYACGRCGSLQKVGW